MTEHPAQDRGRQRPFPAGSPGDLRPAEAAYLQGEPAADRHQALIDRMKRQVKVWQKVGDRRSIFLHCYSLMSGNVLAAVRARQFADSDWVANLMHHFAGYYFEPLAAYDAGEAGQRPVPAVWRHAHGMARDEEATAAQHLLVGVNAHINYDLALAVYDLLEPQWYDLSRVEKRRRRDDHDLINVIIADTVNRVQDEVIERHDPWMELVDRIAGDLDEWLAAQMIRIWRDRVWERAGQLLEAESASERELVRAAMERDALLRMRLFRGL